MKILIVNTFDIYGGAARAAHRLHRSLLGQGIDSQMLVQYKRSDDETVITEKSKIYKFFNNLRPIIDAIHLYPYRNKTKAFFSSSWFPHRSIVDRINEIDPDIVHLHWICLGMIKIEDLSKINAPIVWSLHDMWAFTGGCHYDDECGLYHAQCGNCKVLRSKKEKDLSRKIFKRKSDVFSQMKNLTIVGLSKWLTECSKQSSLLKNHRHINLPNPIDTTVFCAVEKTEARKMFNLPQDKKLVLFGAVNSTEDPRKGFKELCAALHQLQSDDIELVVFGNAKEDQDQDFGFKTHYLGHINNDMELVNLYSAADVMVVPSLQENLSNAIMESLSCATPVVGFDIGGNSDMIDHKKNGYVAKPFDTKDLAQGIEWILHNENCADLRVNARKKVVATFDSKIVAKKYIQLYEDILLEKG
ncbi:MAG: glycosyltransferase family 4 protein [Parcubacteria group bacterium]|jgi:glycosyltransferase involved in cell wall biosynthesis